MIKLLVLSGLGVLAGCATTYDVVQVGPETYQVSAVGAPDRGGLAGAQHRALEAANKKCESLGKAITVRNVDSGYGFFFPASHAVVTFTCT
jgi:hypothetical protein